MQLQARMLVELTSLPTGTSATSYLPSLKPRNTSLTGRVGVALWRGNATAWIHRFPILPPELDGSIIKI